MVGRRGAYHGVRHGNDDFLLEEGEGVIKVYLGGGGTQLLL